jgi:hypothetical protein
MACQGDNHGDRREPARLHVRLARLFLWVAVVLAFIYIIGPFISETPLVSPLTRFIDEHSIDADALFYTEVEEFAEADVHIRNAVRHAPQQKGP